MGRRFPRRPWRGGRKRPPPSGRGAEAAREACAKGAGRRRRCAALDAAARSADQAFGKVLRAGGGRQDGHDRAGLDRRSRERTAAARIDPKPEKPAKVPSRRSPRPNRRRRRSDGRFRRRDEVERVGRPARRAQVRGRSQERDDAAQRQICVRAQRVVDRRAQGGMKGETIYRLRVAGLSKADAAALCARVKGDGGDCFIAK